MNIEMIEFELYFLWTFDIKLFDNISYDYIFCRNILPYHLAIM